MSDELVIAEWSERPFTSFDRRSTTVYHRVVATAYPGVGADVRHEVRCPDLDDVDGWSTAEAYEVRDHGVRRVESDNRWWSA